MKRFVRATFGFAAGIAVSAGSAREAAAQFVAVNNYQTPQAAQAYAPRVAANPYPQAVAYGYGYPRVAQATELPAPAEPVATATPVPQPAMSAGYPAASYPAAAQGTPYGADYGQPISHSYPAPSSCASGNCGVEQPMESYTAPIPAQGYGGCDSGCYAAPACESSACYAPAAPRRQWFAGLYGLYLDRGGDQSKSAVAYLADTSTFTADYYPTATVTSLNTADASDDATGGAEVRFGSTFGSDPCNCQQPFAWEVGYWGLDDDESSATLILPGAVSSTYPIRLYSLYNYQGLMADLDGAGTDWTDRPIYIDHGMPADDDLFTSDVRLLGVRVRQRFQAQNLELNFWRFGAPTVAPSLGGGRLSGLLAAGQSGACADGSCGVGDACGGYGDCGSCRPPRRFFINGLAGVRYLRVDDDFGLDSQFTIVDVPPSGNAGNVPNANWPTQYTSFPTDDNNVMFSDFQADNELVGFQLGSSMNWLVGCRWSFFADGNVGIYGNNAEVYKRIYGGGGAVYTFANGGGPAAVTGSETSLAYVGELRAGVGYQVSCNCRLTAAYRFIGIGGVALGVEEFQNTNWANEELASHIDTNNSIILHGLQAGVEYKY